VDANEQPPLTTSGVVNDAYGAWSYLHCRPSHLSGLVDHIWVFDGSMTCLRERTFPNGLLEIIVQLGDRYSVVEDQGTWLCPQACLTGLQLEHLVVEAPAARTTVLGIRLTPAGAYAVLARPMHELAGLTVDLDDVVGAAASELVDRCGEAATLNGCARAALRWIERRLRTGSRVAPAVGWMVEQIRGRAGAVSVSRLRERTGWTRTRLSSAFVEQVGVLPKHYARLMRFNRALQLVHAADEALADIAARAGYYDQPHFNAEFRELSGLTPTEFRLAHRYPNTVSVAEN
jgi:AraC-like DNA-binding protein